MNAAKVQYSRKQLAAALVASSMVAAPAFAEGPFDLHGQWMTGDWGGARTRLVESGVSLTLDYTTNLGWNASGGYNDDQTVRYLDQWAFGMGLDFERLFNLKGGSFQLTVTRRDGTNLTNDRLIDPRVGGGTSVMANFGGGQTWRLTEMAYRQKLFGDRLDARIGRFGPDEFGWFPCIFQNLMFCGNSGGAWKADVWHNWPVSQWAGQLTVKATDTVSFMVGVFEQNPSLTDRSNGFKLDTSGTTGAMTPVEVIWRPKQAWFALPGEYRAGMFYSSAPANDVFLGAAGLPQPLTPGGVYLSHGHSKGYWVVARQQVHHFDGDPERNVEVFAFGMANDRATTYVRSAISVGTVLTGAFKSRPKDQIGIGFGQLEINNRLADRNDLANQLNGISDYNNPGFLPHQDKEYSTEVYYSWQVAPWLAVRPNIQFIQHPGAVREVEDAWVGGLKMTASF